MSNFKCTSVSKYLMDSRPITITPELAEAIGLNEAIMIQQLHFLLHVKSEFTKMEDYKEGRIWVYNTIEEWQEKYFKFWSISTLKRTINGLVLDKILAKGKFNYDKSDHTLWYTINYEILDQKLLEFRDKKMEEAIDKATKEALKLNK